MKLKHWIRYLLWSDTTWHGEFVALHPLLQDHGYRLQQELWADTIWAPV